MKVTYDFRHMEASAAIKELITKKIEKFQKYFTYPIEAKVRVGVDGTDQWVEITCHAERRQFVCEGKTTDVYEALDMACAKMETQLKKEREKRKGHESAHKDITHLAEDVQASVPHVGKKS